MIDPASGILLRNDRGGLDLDAADDCTARYNLYAFIVWNFLETIDDRCGKKRTCRLRTTWDPIFMQDGRLHLAWFMRQENRTSFKKEFQQKVFREFKMCLWPKVVSR